MVATRAASNTVAVFIRFLSMFIFSSERTVSSRPPREFCAANIRRTESTLCAIFDNAAKPYDQHHDVFITVAFAFRGIIAAAFHSIAARLPTRSLATPLHLEGGNTGAEAMGLR